MSWLNENLSETRIGHAEGANFHSWLWLGNLVQSCCFVDCGRNQMALNESKQVRGLTADAWLIPVVFFLSLLMGISSAWAGHHHDEDETPIEKDCSSSAGDLVINELRTSGGGGSVEFVELVVRVAGVDVSGWTLCYSDDEDDEESLFLLWGGWLGCCSLFEYS